MYKKAFTIIELIIVISIISLLATVGLSTYTTVQEDARNSKRKADLKEIQKALEIYRQEKGAYPVTVGRSGCTGAWCGLCENYNTNGGIFTIEDKDGDSDDPGVDSGDTGYIPDLAPGFMDQLPTDPRNGLANSSSDHSGCINQDGKNACYLYKSNGTNFKLLAHCTPEGTMKKDDAFFDPCRPDWAWQVSSSSTVRGILNAAETGCEPGGW